jgi:hypothetical protein
MSVSLVVQGADLHHSQTTWGANPHIDFAKRDEAKDENIRMYLTRAISVCLFGFGIHQPPNRYILGTVDSKEQR